MLHTPTRVLQPVLAFSLAALSCGGQNPLEAFAPRFTEVLNEMHVPGMVLGVVEGDSAWILPLGFIDPARTQPTSATTPYYIASVTKLFTAQAVLQLAHDGRLQLDAPVRTYLPRFALADPGASDSITVRDLLCHGKGLESWPITFGEAFTGQMTEDRYYRLLSRVRPEGGFSYSNLHYTLLGRVIEAVTGNDWRAYVRTSVFTPASMQGTTTSVASLATPEAAVPTGFIGGTIRAVDVRKTDRTMHAAGGMVSTTTDLMRWLRLQIDDGGNVFPAAVIRGMRTNQLDIPDDHPFIPEQQRLGWGLGWMIREHRGLEYVVHNGQYDGWAAHVSYLPGRRVGIVILVNAKDAGVWLTEAIGVHVYERLLGMEARDYLAQLPEMFVTPPAEAVPLSSIVGATGQQGLPWSAFVGTYTNEDWGTLEVSTDQQGIAMRSGDLPLPLVWKDGKVFIAGGDHEGSLVISNGKMTAVDLGMPLPDQARFERVP